MIEWWRIVIMIGLCILSGLFSGLNLGLLGLDIRSLEVQYIYIYIYRS